MPEERLIPKYRQIKLFSREKVETFDSVWETRVVENPRCLIIKWGRSYGLFTHSSRCIEDVYHIAYKN